MVSAIVLSPTHAASQEAVVGPARRVVVARERALRDAVVTHCLEYLSIRIWSSGGADGRSVIQFEGVLPEAAPRVAYMPVDLFGQAGFVVDIPPQGIGNRSFGCTPGPLPLR